MVVNKKNKKKIVKKFKKNEPILNKPIPILEELINSEDFLESKPPHPQLRKVHKKLQKTSIRLAKKNRKMMDLNQIKRSREAESEELRIKVKDLEYLLNQKEHDLKHLTSNTTEEKEMKIKSLLEENKELKSKLDSIKEDVQKKDAVIDLLQKPEYDYKGLVSFDVDRVKAKWIGWSEGANLEEIDFTLINNGGESLSDITLDIHVQDERGNSFLYNGYKVKKELIPRERVSRKVHLFKQLKKKGNYKVEVRVYMQGHDKEIAEQTKILQI